jgi:hypothetical protein
MSVTRGLVGLALAEPAGGGSGLELSDGHTRTEEGGRRPVRTTEEASSRQLRLLTYPGDPLPADRRTARPAGEDRTEPSFEHRGFRGPDRRSGLRSVSGTAADVESGPTLGDLLRHAVERASCFWCGAEVGAGSTGQQRGTSAGGRLTCHCGAQLEILR